MITSQNRPGLPDFSRVTLKNMGRPGDEAIQGGKHIEDFVFTAEEVFRKAIWALYAVEVIISQWSV